MFEKWGKNNKPESLEVKREFKSKESKLNRTTGLKIARIVIWAILVFIFIRGTLNLIRPDPVSAMQKQEKNFMNEISSSNALENRAFSFAQNFAKDYMTHIPKDDDSYKQRLLKYMPQDLADSIKFDDSDYTTVLYSQAYDIKKYSGNQYDVFVYLRVQYRIPDKNIPQVDPNNIQYTTSENDVYLDVPIAYSNNFVVEDVPSVAAPQLKGYIQTNTYNGDSAADNINSDVQSDLNQFFKAYYEQNQTQVDYFLDLDNGQQVNALNGRYKFNNIDKITTYNTNTQNVYLAVVEFNVQDVNGNLLPQKFNVKITKKDRKYYINQLNTRSVDITNK